MKKKGSTKVLNCLKLSYDNLAGNRYRFSEDGIECMIKAIAEEFKSIYSKSNTDDNKLAPIILGRLLNYNRYICVNDMLKIDDLFSILLQLDYKIFDRSLHYKNNKVSIDAIIVKAFTNSKYPTKNEIIGEATNKHINISMKKLQKIWDSV